MRLAVALGTLLAAACATRAVPVAAGLDEPFRVSVGGRAVLDGGRLAVDFRGVPADSRCPTDVLCVRAGEATVALRLSGPGLAPADLELLTVPGRDSGEFGGYRVELLGLSPEPTSAGVPPDAYVAVLRVRRG